MRVLARRLTTAITLAAVAPAGPALAEPPSFSVRNASEATVSSVLVSPDYRKTWSDNRLDGAGIPPGGERRIVVRDGNGHCFYDVLIVDSAGAQQEIWGLNLCAAPQVEHR